MTRTSVLAAGVFALSASLTGPALTQHQGHQQSAPPSAYAGFETRSTKALSESQIADLRAGRGMGLALAAELNGYPGPMHVLELADKLVLTPEQRTRMQGLIHAMKQETIAIGGEVITAETALDRLFAEKRVDAASLAKTTKVVAEANGRLREAHLRYHLDTRAALTLEQVEGYARLRGYAARP
ncbi:MAG: hypothetical protein FD175_2769 [Beijerinckiaceae bacterium]|nr:MAG: hypothetical protein FD175_2769 [Beijerinckiaceae bacterium]